MKVEAGAWGGVGGWRNCDALGERAARVWRHRDELGCVHGLKELAAHIIVQVLQTLVPHVFIKQAPDNLSGLWQVGFEHTSNLTGPQRRKENLDICRAAATDAFEH